MTKNNELSPQAKALITHGGSNTRLYKIWQRMKMACYTKSFYLYKDIGAKGIKVYDEWLDFEKFREYALEHGYKEELTINRIDNDKDYEPGNIEFIEIDKKRHNMTKHNRMITYKGVTKSLSEWADDIGITRQALSGRLERHGYNNLDVVLSKKPLLRSTRRRKTNK